MEYSPLELFVLGSSGLASSSVETSDLEFSGLEYSSLESSALDFDLVTIESFQTPVPDTKFWADLSH